MDTTKCIEQSQWEQYAGAKLSSEELRMLQTHVVSCEICADIKEGIDAMQNPEKLKPILAEIHHTIDLSIQPKKARILPIYYWLSAAAMFLFGAFFMYTYINPRMETTPLVQTIQKSMPEPKVIDTANIAESTDFPHKLIADKGYEPKKRKVKTPEILEAKPTSIELDLAKSTQTMDDQTAMKEDLPVVESEQIILAQTKNLSEGKTKLLAESSEFKKQSVSASKAPQMKAIYPSNLSNNLSFENKIDFSLNLSNSADTGKIHLARTLIVNHQLDSAEHLLKDLTRNLNKEIQEESWWLLAEVYKQQNKAPEQKNALEELLKMKGKYEKQATELLKGRN